MAEKKEAAKQMASNDDRLLAALAYLVSPLVPIIILLLDDKKNIPYIREHNAQALIFGLVNIVAGTITAIASVFLVGLICCTPFSLILFIYLLILTYKAYQGESIEIPVITNFVKNQGWA